MNKELIELLIIIAVALFLSGLLLLIVTMSVNSPNYKYYKVTYNAIKNCSYVMVRNSSYGILTYHRPEEANPYTNDEILFFLYTGNRNVIESIKLLSPPSDNHYIHNKGGSDLYARYWFKKIINARDKYNHSLWVTTREVEVRENMSNFYIPQRRSPFKFLRG
jgi:hypothetical protein